MPSLRGTQTEKNLLAAFAAECTEASESCIACAHPKAYFEVLGEAG